MSGLFLQSRRSENSKTGYQIEYGSKKKDCGLVTFFSYREQYLGQLEDEIRPFSWVFFLHS